MRRVSLRVTGMSCRHCLRDVTRRIRDVPGVRAVSADAATVAVVVHGTMDTNALLTIFADDSYEVLVVDES
jgi:copper chaperone CopZ